LDRSAQLLSTAANSITSHSRGLAQRGFGGTVESARLDYAMEQLSRQVAAVFTPVLTGMTYAARRAEEWLRGMNGNEQNKLMGAGIGAVAGYRLGGGLGALAGGAIGAAALSSGEMSIPQRLAVTAGSAYFGFRAAGPYGAAAAGATAAVGTSGDYQRMRDAGKSRLAASAVSVGGAVGDVWYSIIGGDNPLDEARKNWDKKRKPTEAPRRDVTPYSLDPTEAGGQHDILQKLVIRATMDPKMRDAMDDANNPLKPLIDIGFKILELLSRAIGVTPPMSAEGART
jgi:hypothetical protein